MYRERARSIDIDLATFRRSRWERPVLRGQAVPGNAAEEAYRALAKLEPLSPQAREELATRVHQGPSAGETRVETESQAEALDALRAAGTRRFAQTQLYPELGATMQIPDYARVVDAALLLLVQAEAGDPSACLAAAADVIRLGQDLVPGGPLEALDASARLSRLAAKVMLRCAARADLRALQAATHELHTLATRPPPSGATLELHELTSAMKLRSAAALTNKDSPLAVLAALRERPALIAALATYDDPTRFRNITPAKYPDALDEWRGELRARVQSQVAAVAADSQRVLDYFLADMRGQATLRALAVAVATLAERAYRGVMPREPLALQDAALVDPFRGRPLNHRTTADGSALVLWSVGDDLKDDGGKDTLQDGVPVDITLLVPLQVAQAATPRAARKASR